MASRRKKDPAALRTIGLFTGQTPLEKAEATLREEDELASRGATGERDIEAEAEEGAVRWLGLDAFRASGDDIRVAVHPKGHAVVVLVYADAHQGARGTVQFKLTRAQWQKLRKLAREA